MICANSLIADPEPLKKKKKMFANVTFMLHCSVEVSLEMFLNFGQLCGFEIYAGSENNCSIYDISTKSPRLKANVSHQNIFGGKGRKNIHNGSNLVTNYLYKY